MSEQQLIDDGYEVVGEAPDGRRTQVVDGVHVYLKPEEVTVLDAAEVVEDAAQADYKANHKYKADRAAAYPPIGDQLDAILKQMNQDRLGGKELVQGVDDILAAWLGVKSAHPKPE